MLPTTKNYQFYFGELVNNPLPLTTEQSVQLCQQAFLPTMIQQDPAPLELSRILMSALRNPLENEINTGTPMLAELMGNGQESLFKGWTGMAPETQLTQDQLNQLLIFQQRSIMEIMNNRNSALPQNSISGADVTFGTLFPNPHHASVDCKMKSSWQKKERNIFCKYCTKAFKHGRDARVHERIHTGERPFSCEQCGKKFKARATLKMHSRIHEERKSYTCKICYKVYIKLDTFERHENKHAHERMIVTLANLDTNSVPKESQPATQNSSPTMPINELPDSV